MRIQENKKVRQITLVWMYPTMMDLYGDQGNIKVFEQRCKERGIVLRVRPCGVGETMDLAEADILFMGGGADQEQGLLYDDLILRKQNMEEAIASGTMVLLICGGFQLFGKYYKDKDGKVLEGLGIFDYHTESDGVHRSIGNLVVEGELDGKKHTFVGFENHGGMTYGVTKPLGKVLYGHGNNTKEQIEGYFDGQVLGTYLHGPLLPKNFEIADYFIQKALIRRKLDSTLQEMQDDLAIAAKNVMIERCLKK